MDDEAERQKADGANQVCPYIHRLVVTLADCAGGLPKVRVVSAVGGSEAFVALPPRWDLLVHRVAPRLIVNQLFMLVFISLRVAALHVATVIHRLVDSRIIVSHLQVFLFCFHFK